MPKYRNKRDYLAKQVVGLPLNQKAYIKNIFPSYLGIFFIGKIPKYYFSKLKSHIDLVFDSFFFDIVSIKEIKQDNFLNEISTKEEFNLLDRNLSTVTLFPTNIFYSMIKDQMLARNLAFGLGVTNLPIYSSSDEELLFLFGEANLKYNSAIVSTHSLWNCSENEATEERIIKEAIHEIGHLILGSEHCSNENCVMWFSANIAEIDRKSYCLCKKCKSELENIRTIFNF
ncbi:MAG: hypothetical protein ACXAC5_22430 [Promethearchaeota archaeon]|jgi:predicted Zn-dependent protease